MITLTGVSMRVCAAILISATVAHAAPVNTAFPAGGSATSAVSSASLSGYYAIADSGADSIEIRDPNQVLLKTITRANITTLLPWMSLDASADGPSSLCFSDSGRLLFFAVHDAAASPDAQPSDAILRYDTQLDQLSVFVRVNLSAVDSPAPHPGMLHYKGRLHVGNPGAGQTTLYRAERNDLAAVPLGTSTLPNGAGTTPRSFTVDRISNTLWCAYGDRIARATAGLTAPTYTQLLQVSGASILGVAYSSHFGGPTQGGFYFLQSLAGTTSIRYLTTSAATTGSSPTPSTYATVTSDWTDLQPTFAGELLAATAIGPVIVRDNTDVRLSYSAWLNDEFAQVVAFGRGLISPDGEPSGWVIDADTVPTLARFHPATPDGACFTILLLLMNDHLNADPNAQAQVRQILARYAGRVPGGPAPSRTADGIIRHWIDPNTGNNKPGWDAEYATLSTMLIVAAANRAAAFYPDDQSIQVSARSIISQTKNWDAYFSNSSAGVYFKGLVGGGPDLTSLSRPFNESILFAQQASAYGGSASDVYYTFGWINRAAAPTATFVTGRPISSDNAGSYLPAFVSIYPLLMLNDYRNSPDWRTHVLNLRLSNMAWTDDNGPRWNTVFSAGTAPSGYTADNLGTHTADIATFTALLGLSAGTGAPGVNFTPAAGGGYHAYRVGARQTFRTGASILYRRSSTSPTYNPNSAGLPDVAMGALGLADVIQPGSVAQVLSGPYLTLPCNIADITGAGGFPVSPDQQLTIEDFLAFLATFGDGTDLADVTGAGGPPVVPDGQLTIEDFLAFLAAFGDGCP